MSTYIHHTAIVDQGASIGDGCNIWHWVHICSDAVIGNGCSFGQNVYVGNNIRIGSGVKVQNNVSIYDNVILEDNVFCGPSMVFTNVINPRSSFPRKNEFRTTIVRKGATLGANCTIVCGYTLGRSVFVGAGAVVTSDLKDYGLYVGVPAKQIGWMSPFGERMNLPLTGDGFWDCSHTGKRFVLSGSSVRML